MEQVRDGEGAPRSWRGGRLLPAAVFVVLSLAAVIVFFVVRSNVDNQNRRLLRERTGEVALLLQSAVGNLPTSLQPLGVAQRLGGTQAFLDEANAQAKTAPTESIALMRTGGGPPTVIAAAGLAPIFPDGTTLTGVPARAIAAAVDGKLTATPVFRFGRTHLIGFALGSPSTSPGRAILIVVPIHPSPTATHTVTQQRPFDELDVAVYAAPRPDPSQLVLTTTKAPLTGDVAYRRIPVGGTRWLLAATAHTPLGGSFPDAVPWIVLAVGLFGAGIATGFLLMFQRRRDYAMALVDARTAELNDSLDELSETQARLVFQERLAAIGQVAAAVGHELRNPLGVLTNSLYLIRTALPSGDTERIERHLATADREIGAAVVIVEGLLDFARQSEPELEEFDLDDLVDEALTVAAPPAGIDVARRTLDDVGGVRGDRQQLRQVLLNLLTNAYAAIDGEGVIMIDAVADGKRVEIRVSDTGVGMDEDTVNHIFDPFYTRKAKGIGLGLAVTRRIVEAHGGTIAVRSAPGEGTTFAVKLPGALVPKAEAPA
ncbi:MAG TPA: ATP-binding protein [Gaiellales bacterium]|nr:ATP-binding protein [Gaiellales bacterium]